MNGHELKEWRRAMKFTQQLAADALGVTRATVQNWEYEITPIPVTVDLASKHLLRRKRRCPEFGPVTLVYSNIPLPNASEIAGGLAALTCRKCLNSIEAFQKINKLSGNLSLFHLMIFDDLGNVIWSGAELLKQCEGFRSPAAQTRAGS